MSSRTHKTNQMATHNEHLRKADESYEVRHDNKGNAIHVYIKDGEAIIYPTLWDFIRYTYFADTDVERFYLSEDDLSSLYDSPAYDFYNLKPRMKRLASRRIYKEKGGVVELNFNHDGKEYKILLPIEDSDFWATMDGFDIHYCEDYNDICVYEQGVVSESIHSQKIK